MLLTFRLLTQDFGYVAGAEIEFRKIYLILIPQIQKKLSTGNASYLYSDQELSSSKVIKLIIMLFLLIAKVVHWSI
jgi:hypothetical protein